MLMGPMPKSLIRMVVPASPVSAEGYGSLSVESPKHLISYSQFGITIVPAGGSPGPTGEKVLGGQF